MSARRPYVRSMAGWWRKNPWFIEYMVHEGTALFVAIYAAILLASVVVLGNGEAAWKWRFSPTMRDRKRSIISVN